MTPKKIAITMDEALLKQLDSMVKSKIYPSRSKAIQEAFADKLERIPKTRLGRECAALDPDYECSFSEEGFSMEIDGWPEY
ncbi:MAG: ribbon-helix-helix domain-containing protein [Desulfococcaceae bacterium]